MHEEILKTEVNRLVNLGILKNNNHSEWAAPIFIIHKKNGTARVIPDFRELNKFPHIELCPFSRKLCTILLPW